MRTESEPITNAHTANSTTISVNPVRTRRVERGQQREERDGRAERDEAAHREPG